MSRLAKFSHEQILGVTARLISRGGPGHATMARIADALQAPTGSIYHRFSSRNVLLGEVWLRAAQAFQNDFIELLSAPCPWDAGLAAALFVPARVRQEPADARNLLLHRREDFFSDGWPPEMSARAVELKRQVDAALRSFSRRLLGRADAQALRTVAYALVEAPLAAVLPHLRANEAPPPYVEPLIRATYTAVMTLAGVAPPSSLVKRKKT